MKLLFVGTIFCIVYAVDIVWRWRTKLNVNAEFYNLLILWFDMSET